MARKPRTKKPARAKQPVGNPTKYTRAKADAILAAICEGDSVREVCELNKIPMGTFFGWVLDDRDGIAERYSRAQKLQAAAMLAECREIADNGRNDWMERHGRNGETFSQLNGEHVRRSEIRLKYRQWFFEQAQAGGLSMRAKEAREQEGASAGALLDLLGRVAAAKAAQA
jgi:hypothetical protein